MLNRPQLASKRTANSIKTQDNLHQKARQFAPKRMVFSTKTQGKLQWLHEYNQQKGAICIFITIDIDREQRLLRRRSGEKSGYLGAKSRDF